MYGQSKNVRPVRANILGTQRPSGLATVRPNAVTSTEVLKQEAIERARQLAALQEQIATAQKALQLSIQKNVPSVRPTLQQSHYLPATSGITKESQVEPRENVPNPYFDPQLKPEGKLRKPRALNFVERGKYEAEAQKMRAREQLEQLQKQIAESAKKAGMESVVDIDISTLQETVPDIEWWDSVILNEPTYDHLETMVKYEAITHYIQHPISLKSQHESISTTPRPIMLTTKETKKLRRQRRLANEKEKQDKIRMGLIPPPEPKGKKEPLNIMSF
jgi:U4/U6 small nuclear ribonucleoprotein PRP3